MKTSIKLFLVLLTLTVGLMGWITGQLRSTNFLILILVLGSVTLLSFLILNLQQNKVQSGKKMTKEANSINDPDVPKKDVKRSDGTFVLREKKSGLTWGGGNIKASVARRGTKKKFLGK